MIAVDTNLLVYAHREDSPHHVAAKELIDDLGHAPQQWAIPWPCVHELLAVITHPRIYDPPTAPERAAVLLQSLDSLPNLVLLSETGDHARILQQLLRPGVAGPKIHDARVAAICLGHGVSELWSADRDFGWFPQLRVRNPLVG